MKFSLLKNIFFFYALIISSFSTIAQKNDCNYFNLQKPTKIPQHFNPEILDLNGKFKFNVEMKSCNEIYFTAIDSRENIYFSTFKNGNWSKPKIASFSDSNYSDADPFLTKDGKRMYFISERPTHEKDDNIEFNIWYADRENDDWTTPKPLGKPINSDENNEYFFSISDKGNVFFSSNRKGGEGSFDIYTAKIIGNTIFSEPKNVGIPISTSKYEFDPFISSDEKLIIFSINENGNSSLYYSKKDDNGNWKKPKNLGEKINITRQDFAPSLSADGEYLFFSNNGKLMWVSSKILE